jgi:plastocyanin
MNRLIATIALAAVTLAAAACGSGNAAEPSAAPSAPPVDPGKPFIASDSLKWDRAELKIPAGTAFELVYENREGPPHNVAIYTDGSANTPVFVGEIISGPKTVTYQVPAIEAGTYFFRCDVHPDMQGTVTAE